MKKNYQKEYINFSNEFRKSENSKESIEKLFDLLYELEEVNKSQNEEKILSNIYALLGFHKSAYEVYKTTADLTNKKEIKKLYTLEQKAKSHANNCAIKDIRKLREKKEQSKLLFEDFKIDENEENKNRFILKNKDIVIFNKTVETEKFDIYIYGNHKFKDYIAKIIAYIFWLGNCQNELIDFYNSELSEHIGQTANKDWYDTLDVFRARIIVGQNGKLFSEISGGDEFIPDHILDIETEEREIKEMSYDG